MVKVKLKKQIQPSSSICLVFLHQCICISTPVPSYFYTSAFIFLHQCLYISTPVPSYLTFLHQLVLIVHVCWLIQLAQMFCPPFLFKMTICLLHENATNAPQVEYSNVIEHISRTPKAIASNFPHLSLRLVFKMLHLF